MVTVQLKEKYFNLHFVVGCVLTFNKIMTHQLFGVCMYDIMVYFSDCYKRPTEPH